MKQVHIRNGLAQCEICRGVIPHGSKAWTFPMGAYERFLCEDCRQKIETREAIIDLIALHGGGSLGRQIKAGTKRGLVLAPAYLLLAIFFGLPGFAIVVLGLLGSCSGHNYFR